MLAKGGLIDLALTLGLSLFLVTLSKSLQFFVYQVDMHGCSMVKVEDEQDEYSGCQLVPIKLCVIVNL